MLFSLHLFKPPILLADPLVRWGQEGVIAVCWKPENSPEKGTLRNTLSFLGEQGCLPWMWFSVGVPAIDISWRLGTGASKTVVLLIFHCCMVSVCLRFLNKALESDPVVYKGYRLFQVTFLCYCKSCHGRLFSHQHGGSVPIWAKTEWQNEALSQLGPHSSVCHTWWADHAFHL